MQRQRKIFVFIASLLSALAVALSRPAEAQPAAPQKWALLIGIDQYKKRDRINDLSAGARDARALKAALMETAGVLEDHIRLLVSDAAPNKEGEALPDRAAILRELAMLARRTQSGDTVFVCYSGHGMELANHSAYLLPWDADPYDEGTLTDTAISEAKLVERLKAIPAALLILTLDMCRTQPLKNGRDGVTEANKLTAGILRGMDFALMEKAGVSKANAPQAVVRLWSCGEGQRSWEWAERQRSYFSYFLEQGLRGAAADKDGVVRADTLSAYLREQVTAKVRETEKQEQTPVYKVEGAISASRLALNASGAAPAIASGKQDAVVGAAADSRARLALTLEPKDATVQVDGAARNGNPIVVNLGDEKEKVVEVAISAAGYKTSVMNVTLRRGTRSPLSVTLEKTSSGAGKPVAVNAPAPLTWRNLFDGKTLDGWERTIMQDSNGGTGGVWKASADGVIGWQEAGFHGGLLRTTAVYDDFELDLEFLLDVPGDSGVFLRTNENGDGYQITMDEVAGGTVGSLFASGPGGGFLVRDDGFKAAYRLGEWNRLRARIEGQPPHIQVLLNDRQTVNYVGSAANGASSGHIGLQVRGGEKYWGAQSRVRFRNVRIRPLKPVAVTRSEVSASNSLLAALNDTKGVASKLWTPPLNDAQWHFDAYEGTDADISRTGDGPVKITVNKKGNPWTAQLSHRGYHLNDFKEGMALTVRFRAKADPPRTILVGSNVIAGGPSERIFEKTFRLSTEWQPHEYRFIVAKPAAARGPKWDNDLWFWLGDAVGGVWLDGFSLTDDRAE